MNVKQMCTCHSMMETGGQPWVIVLAFTFFATDCIVFHCEGQASSNGPQTSRHPPLAASHALAGIQCFEIL